MTQEHETVGDEIVRKVFVATAASLLGAFIGSLLLPGPGTALGAKLGALAGGSSSDSGS